MEFFDYPLKWTHHPAFSVESAGETLPEEEALLPFPAETGVGGRGVSSFQKACASHTPCELAALAW